MGAWFALIDGACDPRLEGLVRQCRDHICLFRGQIDPRIAQVAPWLVRIDERDPLLSIWQQHGRGLHWGMMAYSELSLDALRGRFRRSLQAMLPDGTVALFRFYDPRVFNTYLRAATPEERAPWFEGIWQYDVEQDGGAAMHHYRLTAGRLYDGEQLLG